MSRQIKGRKHKVNRQHKEIKLDLRFVFIKVFHTVMINEKETTKTTFYNWSFILCFFYLVFWCHVNWQTVLQKRLCRIIANVQLLTWLCLSYDWWISMSSCWTLWFSSLCSSTDYLKHLHMMKKLGSSCWIKTKEQVSASRRAEGILLLSCHTSETEENFKCASVMLHLAASEMHILPEIKTVTSMKHD